MAHSSPNSNQRITAIETTTDTLTSRGGLALFVRYLTTIDLFPLLDRWFGSLRKSRKGTAIVQLFKELFCFFLDGTSPHLTYFDVLHTDPGYAGVLEAAPDTLSSSHTIKRFFGAFSFVRVWLFRHLLQRLFLWRLQVEQPPVIYLDLDVMPMDNNDAEQREGVQPTYKSYRGFAPLQLTGGPYIIDAVFRGGSKHSNHGETVEQMIRHVVRRIRTHYDPEAVIVLTQDSGFFDQALLTVYEALEIGYIVGGKAYKDLRRAVASQPETAWQAYQQGEQQWLCVELGDRRGTWSRFRRMVYSQAKSDDTGQLLLDCARPETVLYTNIGVDAKLTTALVRHEDEEEEVSTVKFLLTRYHLRGKQELVHRALKEFGSEQLPFHKFTANAAWYYVMLTAFTLYEAFKRDLAVEGLPVTCYPTRFRRTLIDLAAKVVTTSGRRLLRFAQAAYDALGLDTLWERVQQVTPLPALA